MNISGIRPSVGFYDENSIKIRQEYKIQDIEKSPLQQADVDNDIIGIDSANVSNQSFSSYDYANQYKPGEIYNLKGADSDIKSLDIEKAVDDMKKDSIIQQYQYFVSDKTTGTIGGEDKRDMENFTL